MHVFQVSGLISTVHPNQVVMLQIWGRSLSSGDENVETRICGLVKPIALAVEPKSVLEVASNGGMNSSLILPPVQRDSAGKVRRENKVAKREISCYSFWKQRFLSDP